MRLCIFNPEHDLCMVKGRAFYIPPRSAVAFAQRDCGIMSVLYPDAVCRSVYDEDLHSLLLSAERITPWGWNVVLKHELLKRGAAISLLPTDAQLSEIRRLQHRSTVLPLQTDARAVEDEKDVETMLNETSPHLVLKAPWSGAGRGLRWVHSAMSDIDKSWLAKTVREQGMVIAEPRREVVEDMALEYMIVDGDVRFEGYSLFRTGSGVYRGNIALRDEEIERHVCQLLQPQCLLQQRRMELEGWLKLVVAPHYSGPVGIDLMVCSDGHLHVAEMNLRHTMGMVAHAKNLLL